jgi:hypothetical protein
LRAHTADALIFIQCLPTANILWIVLASSNENDERCNNQQGIASMNERTTKATSIQRRAADICYQ